MEPRLKFKLYDGWQKTENPGGPVTYLRGNGPSPGTLQFSSARPRSGAVARRTSEQDLISMCEKLTRDVANRSEVTRSSGTCEFGIFGTIAVKGTSPAYVQAWVLSNQSDYILVTLVCYTPPDAQETKEAHEIALMTGLS